MTEVVPARELAGLWLIFVALGGFIGFALSGSAVVAIGAAGVGAGVGTLVGMAHVDASLEGQS